MDHVILTSHSIAWTEELFRDMGIIHWRGALSIYRGEVPAFRTATIGISRRGWIEDVQAPYYHLHVPRHLRIPPEVNQYLQNEGWEKMRLLGDEEEIQPGIRVFWSGVHHRSSMAIAIDTSKGTVIITDSFFKYINIGSTAILALGKA